METSSKPIFIHSLFRSGSTYLFNVFRRSDAGYWCYQEPLHEVLGCIDTTPETLLAFHGEPMRHLRHPDLSRPYFYEFYEIREHLAGRFRKDFSYDSFFISNPALFPPELTEYIRRLIGFAKGRAVLQFCRSAGRVRPLRQLFDAVHLHLWRNPRDQWWSYKTTDYFDAATQLIYGAQEPPPVLREAKRLAGVADVRRASLAEELGIAQNNILRPADNYLAFFALWLYAFLECEEIADVSINLDLLGHEHEYRSQTLGALAANGVVGLDFSDCFVSRAAYDRRDLTFFEDIEERVIDLFFSVGYREDKINHALVKISLLTQDDERKPAELIEHGSRARQIALHYASDLAETQRLRTEKEHQLSELAAEIAAKDSKFAQDVGRLTTLEGELREVIHQRNAIAAQLASSKDEFSVLSEELIRARETISNHERDLTEAKEHLTRLAGEIHHSKEMAARADGERTQAIEHVRTLINHQNLLETALDDLRVVLADTRQRATLLEDNLSQREEQVSILKRELEVTTRHRDMAESALAQTTRRLEVVEVELGNSKQWALALEADLAQIRSQLSAKLEENATTLARARWAEDERNAAIARVTELDKLSHQWWVATEQLKQELHSVYQSRSWRITLPLRKTMLAANGATTFAKETVRELLQHGKQGVKPAAAWAVTQTLKRPTLKATALAMLVRFPRFKHRVREFALHAGLFHTAGEQMAAKHSTGKQGSNKSVQTRNGIERLSEMPPPVARIYTELKNTIDSHQR